MVTKQDTKQSKNALYLRSFKGTRCLEFEMVVCVLPVPGLIKHTAYTVNLMIVKAMVKEDPAPIKFIVSWREKVNSCFLITEGDNLNPKAEGLALLNPAPPPLDRDLISTEILLLEINNGDICI